ncbi:MAG: MBOAT family protein [Nannocystis sp.]|uniref:MBOAT family O-acyltransferase n=1 Tax=Nannocystis sp. TaxID=1962667 RepID=UPI0024220988|nr:MBOAT family O-acyltransferase [Nannocystis sp.]MBK9756880.1 MBOAT family protein [Nannocystis sp.]
MLFVSFDFLLFIIPVLLLAWALANVAALRVLFLIAASYFFYMAGPHTDPIQPPWYFVGLLFLSTVLDFVCSHRIAARRPAQEAGDAGARRACNAWLGVSLVGNLGLLGYFKYTNFFLGAFGDIAAALGVEVVVPHLRLLLPIGISFYTFQTLSYTIDVWRGRLTPEPSFRRFALFVVFFPQLVAGPIVRAHEFLPQLHRPPQLSAANMSQGMYRILCGVLKKAVLGDFIAAQFTDAVFAAPDTYTSLEILLALYAFTLQLYADFSGYSDIAIGVALLLGYTIPENFDRPYQAQNLGEFWRRWHMTLSTWLRDYVFFPLGGSRGSPARVYFNLWLTMFLVGMWHGASWNFIIYSNVHALAMLFNRWNRGRDRGAPMTVARSAPWVVGVLLLSAAVFGLGVDVLHLEAGTAGGLAGFAAAMFVIVAWLPETKAWWNVALHVALTFHFTVLSRVFFRADDLETSRAMIAGLLRFDAHGVRPGLLSPLAWALLIGGIAYHMTPKRWVEAHGYKLFRALPGPVIGLLFAAAALAVHLLLSGGPRANIYFQF